MAQETANRRRTELVAVRLSEPERRHLERGAAEAEVTISELLRTGARRVALEAIGKATLAEEETA